MRYYKVIILGICSLRIGKKDIQSLYREGFCRGRYPNLTAIEGYLNQYIIN